MRAGPPRPQRDRRGASAVVFDSYAVSTTMFMGLVHRPRISQSSPPLS